MTPTPLETREHWRANILNALVTPHVDCYHDSAPFHELVDTLVHLLPVLLDDAARMAEEERRATATLVARSEAGAQITAAQARAAHPLATVVAHIYQHVRRPT